MSAEPQYTLYYHVPLPGRGEYVRLALEAAGVAYKDVAKVPGGSESQAEVMKELASCATPLFAPPMLKVVEGGNELMMSQTPVCCMYIARRHGLEPDTEQQKLSAESIILTLGDFSSEAHNVHHPVATGKFYDDQKAEAKIAGEGYVNQRIPKFMAYLARCVKYWQKECDGGPFMFGSRLTLVDLFVFHTLRGVQYAFPKGYARVVAEPEYGALTALANAVEKHPRIEAFLNSPRHMDFNVNGIFRHYAELDV